MATYPHHGPRATGSVSHTLPAAVEAGSCQEFVLAYTAGYFGVDDTGSIKICWRYAADIGTPQFDDPGAAHYVSARASNGAALALRYDPKDNVRPWGRTVQVKVLNGFLREGDRIEVRFGDRSGGGPGIRMQTFCESTFELRVLVDPIATYRFQQVEGGRTVAIVPGPPVRWCALLPTAGTPGAPFRLLAKAEDRWGNPTAAEPAHFRLLPSRPVRGLPDMVQIGGGRRAVCLDGLAVDTPGDLEIAFAPERSGAGLPFRSNTMVVKPSLGRRRWWGDLHGQSEETIGSGSAEEYFSFARDLAGLDFAGHQGNDFQITGAFWEHLQRLTRATDEPGRFVAFSGLRVVRQHRARRRPQRAVSERGTADPPQQPCPGRRSRPRHRLYPRHRPVRGAAWPAGNADSARRRSLLRHALSRPDAACGRGALRLGHFRVAVGRCTCP